MKNPTKFKPRVSRKANTSAKAVERHLRETFIEGFGFGLSYLKREDVLKLRKAVKNVSIDGAFWNCLIQLATMSQEVVKYKTAMLEVKK